MSRTEEMITRAEEFLARVSSLPDSDLEEIAILGSDVYEQGRNEQARTIFEGLIGLNANAYYGFAGLGAIALSEEKLDEAQTYLQIAVELNPQDPAVRANLGETFLRKGQFQEAAAEFEKALDLDPEQRNPGANRARAIIRGMETFTNEVRKLEAAGNA